MKPNPVITVASMPYFITFEDGVCLRTSSNVYHDDHEIMLADIRNFRSLRTMDRILSCTLLRYGSNVKQMRNALKLLASRGFKFASFIAKDSRSVPETLDEVEEAAKEWFGVHIRGHKTVKNMMEFHLEQNMGTAPNPGTRSDLRVDFATKVDVNGKETTHAEMLKAHIEEMQESFKPAAYRNIKFVEDKESDD